MSEAAARGATPLFDSAFLRRLELLSLEVRRRVAGDPQGARRSQLKGAGIEFADHRSYQPGDDVRHVDWHLYGRLGKLFVKVHETEQETTLHLLVDRSASMGFGDTASGDPTKLAFACRVAGALAYVALAGLDRVRFAAYAEGLAARFGPVRGKGQAHALFHHLEGVAAEGATDPRASLKAYAAAGRSGLAVVISDFLDPGGWQDGLRSLLAARYDVFALQVLAPEEIDPPHLGELSLVDAETGQTLGLTINEAVRGRYVELLEKHCLSVEAFCHERGIGYARARSDLPFEEFVLRTLRRTPLLR